MKRLIPLFVLSVVLPALFGAAVITVRGPVGTPSAGAGLAAFEDNFDRTDSDSLGANWTEADGDADIYSNTMRLSEGSFGENFAIYSGEACTTVSQYVLVTYHTEGGYPQIPLRYTNSSTAFYFIEFSNTTVDWYHKSQIGGTSTQINASTGTISISSGTEIGITITGTGTSTEVKIFIGPTPGYTPTDPSTWGAADITFTDNPASAVDTGSYVGLGGVQGSADIVRYNNFYGGDIP